MSENSKLDGRRSGHVMDDAFVLPDRSPAAWSLLAHPDEVLSDPKLTKTEKRAILASWASDARAVVDAPAQRQLDNGAVVRVEEVLCALRSLDDAVVPDRPKAPPFARRNSRRLASWVDAAIRWNRPDDDDDPPPCAAGAAIPVRRITVVAKAVSVGDRLRLNRFALGVR